MRPGSYGDAERAWFLHQERKAMLLDDAGMWNQYMVHHRIAVRADANIVLELTELLKG